MLGQEFDIDELNSKHGNIINWDQMIGATSSDICIYIPICVYR